MGPAYVPAIFELWNKRLHVKKPRKQISWGIAWSQFYLRESTYIRTYLHTYIPMYDNFPSLLILRRNRKNMEGCCFDCQCLKNRYWHVQDVYKTLWGDQIWRIFAVWANFMLNLGYLLHKNWQTMATIWAILNAIRRFCHKNLGVKTFGQSTKGWTTNAKFYVLM
jgi:hypothetical protein